jgi:hypothetical protein
MILVLLCFFCCALSIFEDEVGIVDEYRAASHSAIHLDERDVIVGPGFRRHFPGALEIVSNSRRVFGLGERGQLLVLDAVGGALLWSSFDGFRGLALLEHDLDGDGWPDVAVAQGTELTVRSGASGAGPLWSQKIDESFGRSVVGTGIERDDELCVYGVNETGFAVQCWSLSSQAVVRRSGAWKERLDPVWHMFADKSILLSSCKLLQFASSAVLVEKTERPLSLAFARCRVRREEVGVVSPGARFRNGTLEGRGSAGEALFRLENLLDCATDLSSHHSNLFASSKKLVLRSGVVCLSRQQPGGGLLLLLVDAADGTVWRTAELRGCTSDEAAVRAHGNTAVTVCRAAHGYQISVLDMFENAPTETKVKNKKERKAFC